MQNKLTITEETLEAFLNYISESGHSINSWRSYRQIVTQFFDFLPEEKVIGPDTVFQWQKYMIEQGYANSTNNARLYVINHFMNFLGKREWQYVSTLKTEKGIMPELTRQEYLRLLQAAKWMGKERTYLIIKTLCNAGVRLHELQQVTVEAVTQGNTIIFFYCHNQRQLSFPRRLREELLAYAARQGITQGPIFVTRNGNPVGRSNIWTDIQKVCIEAKVAEEKASARCLWDLHQQTYKDIAEHISVLITQAYEKMLDKEELTVGWDVYGEDSLNSEPSVECDTADNTVTGTYPITLANKEVETQEVTGVL